ncbi:MAG: pyridoxamine 5'-phosphate oxidase family protein [Caldilineaceae bacterium]
MPTMNPPEIDSFLAEPRHAIVGTVARDGAPQLSPVWYIYEDGRFYIGITSDTAKYRNLRRDQRISLCIDGGRADVRTVMGLARQNCTKRITPCRGPCAGG